MVPSFDIRSFYHLSEVLHHELVHAIQYCQGYDFANRTCRSRLCAEMQAYSIGGCRHETDPAKFEICVRDSALLSAGGGCTQTELNYIDLGDLFDDCARDMNGTGVPDVF